MREELTTTVVELGGNRLELLQPRESAELPDDGAVEWAPLAPYWSVLWRSGVALAEVVSGADLRDARVLELGCGLGLPSVVAARGGARVLATDAEPEALELLGTNAARNHAALETAEADWAAPDELLRRGPFDLVLAADVLYERPAAAQLLALLPKLAPAAWLADPARPAAEPFLEQARQRWAVASDDHGVVTVHRLRLGPSAGCP